MEDIRTEELYVEITRSHGSLKTSVVNVNELYDPRWGNKSGGYQKKHAGSSLYAYISYRKAMELVDCSGEHDYGKNDVRVLIIKQNPKSPYYQGYQYLADLAGDKGESLISQQRPKGQGPCTKKILALLSNGPLKRGSLRDTLCDIGYQTTTIGGALHRLKRQEKIICEGPPQSKNQLISLNPQKINTNKTLR